jgi:tripartite-type tricarboxylate transporter receptor subunit TctC
MRFFKYKIGILIYAFALSVSAQPIELVVPYPAGGSTDRFGRVVAQILSDSGIPTLVSNRPGADTTIASNYVAKAKGDGKVLYLCGIGFLDANLAFKNKPEGIEYKRTSFSNIALLGSGTLVLSVSQKVPVNNYEEFKNYVRNNPNKFNVGFFNQNISNLFYVWAKKEGLPTPNIVMYKGSTPMGLDLLGGHIEFAWDTFNTIEPHISSGKVKVIAVLDKPGYQLVTKSLGRELFNVAEKYPEFNMPIFYGLCGPAFMNPDNIKKLNKVVIAGLKDPKYTQPLTDSYIGVSGGSPADLDRMHTNLYLIFNKIAKETDK